MLNRTAEILTHFVFIQQTSELLPPTCICTGSYQPIHGLQDAAMLEEGLHFSSVHEQRHSEINSIYMYSSE